MTQCDECEVDMSFCPDCNKTLCEHCMFTHAQVCQFCGEDIDCPTQIDDHGEGRCDD